MNDMLFRLHYYGPRLRRVLDVHQISVLMVGRVSVAMSFNAFIQSSDS